MPHGSNNQLTNCLFNSLFRFTTKKTPKLHITEPCVWGIHQSLVDSTHTGPSNMELWCFLCSKCRFPSQRASNAGSVSMSWWLPENTVWSHYNMVSFSILTHWGRDKMAAVSQTTLSNAFSWTKMLEFRLRFHWSLFLRVQLTIIQHWFRLWLGAGQATSHYLNQW